MKNKFIKSTLILMIGTCITKVLGFLIKIVFTRLIKDGINIYSLVIPTYSLIITITSLGLPYAISVVMARNNLRGIHIISSIIPITLLFNGIIMLILYLSAPFLSTHLLKNPSTYYPLIAIIFAIPFTSISGIIKGYYFGKQNMLPNAISNIIENLTRLILTIIFIPVLMKESTIKAVTFYIIISGICEIVQIIIYLFFAPKKMKITLHDITPKVPIMNEILSLSIPSLGSRLIGNISYFLEPILLTNILSFVGYSNNFIISEYATYTSYVIPLLTLPSFITLALNTTLMPEISAHYNNKEYIKKLLLKIIKYTLVIGTIFCMFLYIKGDLLLKLIYDTNQGYDYIKFLSIIFPLFYLEGTLSSTLQGLGLSKFTLFTTTSGCIIKNIVIIITSFLSIGIYSLLISEIINIIYVIILNYKKLKQLKYL